MKIPIEASNHVDLLCKNRTNNSFNLNSFEIHLNFTCIIHLYIFGSRCKVTLSEAAGTTLS